MKKTLIFVSSLAFSSMLTAQATWNGTGPTGNAYRSGNIGINESAPSFALDVTTGTSLLNNGIRINNKNTTGSSGLFLRNDIISKQWEIWSLGAGNPWGAGNFCIYDGYNSVPQFFIDYNTKNTGIGTQTPSNMLSIKTGVLNDGVKVSQTGTSAAALHLSNVSGHDWALFSTGIGNSQGGGNFSIYDYNSGADRFFIQGSTGNVGIGTITPLDKLHVHDGTLRITGTVPGYGGPSIMLGGSSTVAPLGEWSLQYNNSTAGQEGLNFWRPYNASGPVNGNYFLFLANTGKVGVNTNTPTAQFTVNGNVLIGDPATVSLPIGYKLYVETGILTEKVKVALKTTSDWADYVFEKNYNLKSIEEVNAFVDANKHLPGVPSAQELKDQGGIDLGKMDAKLLEKIEELTLYVIQLNEKNKELVDRLSKLESTK